MLPKSPTISFRLARGIALAVLLAAALALTLAAGIANAAPTTFTVINTNDSGDGSLRDAITEANSNSNPTEVDTIEFDIPTATDPGCDSSSGVCTISPTSALPEIVEPVIVDGYTQSGASANTLATGNDAQLKIELSGASAPASAFTDGITISAPNSVVKGLIINRWSADGIQLADAGASGNRIEGNYIGTDASGTQDLGNDEDGVDLNDAPDNVVGGTSAAARNVISGNDLNGVIIQGSLASGNSIQGNYIGTDAEGTEEVGNASDGVFINRAPTNLVGGTSAGARNLVSGNRDDGVEVSGEGSTGNRIQGNFIGTDASGQGDLGNNNNGVSIFFAPNSVVGGTSAGARNVISANGDDGIEVDGFDANGSEIQGNYIGTGASGQGDLGNSDEGVYIAEAPNTTVGGTSAAAANTIAFNGGDGVDIDEDSATGNSILRNSIYDNVELGIDLDGGDENPSDVTANDPQDPDLGPNLLQNYPEITSATTPNGRSVSVQGTLNSNPNDSFTIQLFSNPTRDPSGYGEGKTYLGQTNVAVNEGGNASFSFSTQAPVLAGEFITATATNVSTGDTSEFSRAVGVRDETSPRVISTNPANRATGVPARADVFATFSEAMNPSTINQNTFKLFREVGNTQTLVPSTVSYNEEARRGRLDPNANLTPGATYVATVTDRARDLAGNGLDQNSSTPGNQSKAWRFTVAR